jgi:hypothetical protein
MNTSALSLESISNRPSQTETALTARHCPPQCTPCPRGVVLVRERVRDRDHLCVLGEDAVRHLVQRRLPGR